MSDIRFSSWGLCIALLSVLSLTGCGASTSNSGQPSGDTPNNSSQDNSSQDDPSQNNQDEANNPPDSGNSDPSSPDTSAPDTNNPAEDNTDGNEGENNSVDNSEPPVAPPIGSDCQYSAPTPPPLTEHFSRSLTDDTYQHLDGEELVSNNSNVYGTWAIVHQQSSSDTSNERQRLQQHQIRTLLVIREANSSTAQTPVAEIASCTTAGQFSTLNNPTIGDELALPLSQSSDLVLNLTSMTQMNGVAPHTNTRAIKLDASQQPLATVSGDIDGESVTAEDVWCVQVFRNSLSQQQCSGMVTLNVAGSGIRFNGDTLNADMQVIYSGDSENLILNSNRPSPATTLFDEELTSAEAATIGASVERRSIQLNSRLNVQKLNEGNPVNASATLVLVAP